MKTDGYIRDMTQGSPLRHILHFAIPLMIGNLFQQLYNLVDTVVVGYRLGDQAIAAIGATVSLYSLIINLAIDLNNGYGIVVTQRFGAQQQKAMRQAVAGMLVLNAIAALLLTVSTLAFLDPLLCFMNTPAEIYERSRDYIFFICTGIPATIAYNMFSTILRAVGNSRMPLLFLVFASLLNVALDILLVWGQNAGIAGAALATVLSQLAAAVLSGIYVWKHYRKYLPEPGDFRVPGKLLMNLFSTGFAMALTSFVVEFGTVAFQRVTNLLGETMIAAHSAARRIQLMLLQPVISFSVASMTYTGQNWGAGKVERIRPAIRLVMLVELIWCFTSVAVVYLFGSELIRLTTGTYNQEMLQNAVLSLRIHFSMFPMLGILFCLRNSMQAIGQKTIPVLSSCIELVMKLFAAYFLIPRLGFIGVCITEPITWVLMVLFLAGAYWLHHRKWFTQTPAVVEAA